MSSFTDRLMGKLFSRPKHRKAQRPHSAAAVMESSHGGRSGGGGGDARRDRLSSLPEASLKQVHEDAVVSVAVMLPELCLSGSKDGVVRLYDFHRQNLVESWSGHNGAITKVCYGASCNGIFSASRDKTIKLWHLKNPHCVQEFMGHTLVVSAIHFNADSSCLCSGSRDNTVRLWDVESGICTRVNTIPQNLVTGVKFVPGSSLLVQTGEDKEVRIFDLRCLEPVFSFPKKQYIQMCCDVSQDGHYICSSSNGFSGNGCEATVWDLRSRQMLQELRGHHEAVEACVFMFGAGVERPLLVASASRDCTVRLWDRESGACLSECPLSGAGPLTSLATCPDGRILVGSFNQGVHILENQSGVLHPWFHF
ncbi:WD repeat-containing protein 31-like [Plakobranchus ocellatus]|uniref:WD repeat-containing protein 31-like n=1 Tax=Plakobranchus ocellatus TaxID=259542 RepID=A0AAV4DX81_9GAST|nr:WD repeat-containing protein 31-like [Plakobranchus ocellatus]